MPGPGSYTVTLTVSNEGGSDTESKAFTVDVTPVITLNDWPMEGRDSTNTFWNQEESTLYPPLQVVWRYEPPGGPASLDRVTVGSGIAVVTSMADGRENVAFGLDALSGEHIWRFPLTGGGVGSMSVSPAISGGFAFFGGQQDDKLYAIDLRTGLLEWEASGMGGGMYGRSPKIDNGILYVNALSAGMWAFEPGTGVQLWQ